MSLSLHARNLFFCLKMRSKESREDLRQSYQQTPAPYKIAKYIFLHNHLKRKVSYQKMNETHQEYGN